jgi:hypothetical protein
MPNDPDRLMDVLAEHGRRYHEIEKQFAVIAEAYQGLAKLPSFSLIDARANKIDLGYLGRVRRITLTADFSKTKLLGRLDAYWQATVNKPDEWSLEQTIWIDQNGSVFKSIDHTESFMSITNELRLILALLLGGPFKDVRQV